MKASGHLRVLRHTGAVTGLLESTDRYGRPSQPGPRGEAGNSPAPRPPGAPTGRPLRGPHEKAGLYCSRRNLIAGTRSLEQRLPFVTISADGSVYTAAELDACHLVSGESAFRGATAAIIRIRSSW